MQLDVLNSQIYFGMKLYMCRIISLSIFGSFSLYTQQWYMSYRFPDSLRPGSGCSILILLESCQQNWMTYIIAVCTVKNSWRWTKKLSETCRVLFQNKFEKFVHLVGFIIRICHHARSHERKKQHVNKFTIGNKVESLLINFNKTPINFRHLQANDPWSDHKTKCDLRSWSNFTEDIPLRLQN